MSSTMRIMLFSLHETSRRLLHQMARTKISDLTEAESGLTSAGIPLIEPNIGKTRTGLKKCLAPS